MVGLFNGFLFVISGPSGVGKGTIIREALQQSDTLSLTISATTRPPRPGEVHGVDYFFLTQAEFKKKIEQGAFLEWCRVHQNYYGTLVTEVNRYTALGKDVILEIDVQGALKVKDRFEDAILIFIAPPSIEELTLRLRARNTDSEYDIAHRLETARKELSQANFYDYVLVNRSVSDSVKELLSIIHSVKKQS